MKILKKIYQFIASPKTNYPNIYIFSYHVLKAFHKLAIKAGLTKQKYLGKDMFNWSLYDLHYKGELIEDKKRYTMDLSATDYKMVDNKLTKINPEIKSLHTNHRLLYETILQLNPSSVFEMGCGTGMHLNNLQTLAPKITLSGSDLLPQQIIRLRKNYPFLNATIKVADATLPLPENFLPLADLAFTQAVIMHIHTDDLHLKALENLFRMSKKYVLLYESTKNHPFMDDIKKLHAAKKIAWDNLYFYYRINEENNRPASIICSNEKLNYPVLADYNIFSN